jgi:hypothetical protein
VNVRRLPPLVAKEEHATPPKALPAAATSANNSPHLRSPTVVTYVSFHHEGPI